VQTLRVYWLFHKNYTVRFRFSAYLRLLIPSLYKNIKKTAADSFVTSLDRNRVVSKFFLLYSLDYCYRRCTKMDSSINTHHLREGHMCHCSQMFETFTLKHENRLLDHNEETSCCFAPSAESARSVKFWNMHFDINYKAMGTIWARDKNAQGKSGGQSHRQQKIIINTSSVQSCVLQGSPNIFVRGPHQLLHNCWRAEHEIDSLILASWQNLASDGKYLILTKNSDYGNISAEVRQACSAVILCQLTFTWPSYVMSLLRDMLHSTRSTNFS